MPQTAALYPAGTTLPARGAYCIDACLGFEMPPGFAGHANCSMRDIDECASGRARLCGAGADCINRAPLLHGDPGFECACPDNEFASAAQTCEPQGMEVRCEARATAEAPLAAAARLHLVIVAALLDADSGIVALPPAGATREQALHAVRVSSRFAPATAAPAASFRFVVRGAESLVAWTDVAARARDGVERVLAAAGGWGLLPPGV